MTSETTLEVVLEFVTGLLWLAAGAVMGYFALYLRNLYRKWAEGGADATEVTAIGFCVIFDGARAFALMAIGTVITSALDGLGIIDPLAGRSFVWSTMAVAAAFFVLAVTRFVAHKPHPLRR